MKKLSTGLAVIILAALTAGAQDERGFAVERTADATQMSTTLKETFGTLMFTLQRVEGVTPPVQLMVTLVTPTVVNFKEGNGVVLLLDNERVPLKGVCQNPVPHAGGFTQVGLCFLSSAELDHICTAKNLRVSFEGGKAGGHVVFRIPRPDVQFKKFYEEAGQVAAKK